MLAKPSFPALAALIAALAVACPGYAQEAADEPAGPIGVAVFKDAGVSKNVAVVLDVLRESAEFEVAEIDAASIRGGKLASFDLVVFPGGSGSKEAAALEPAGRDEVRKFVRGGGGYLGICAGAYLASADYDWSLHILDAKVIDRAHWARGSGDVEVALTPAGRRLLGASTDRETILYWQGPLLAPAGKDDIPDFDTLGTFATEIAKNGAPRGVMVGTTAIASGSYGSGRVLCFSPHPERTTATKTQLHQAVRWASGKR